MTLSFPSTVSHSSVAPMSSNFHLYVFLLAATETRDFDTQRLEQINIFMHVAYVITGGGTSELRNSRIVA
jgi:hypothetical protein